MVDFGTVSKPELNSLLRQFYGSVWFYTQLHFGRRGKEGLRKLTPQSFVVKRDSAGTKYVTMAFNEETKNHKCHNDRERQNRRGAMFEEPGNALWPVASFEAYQYCPNQQRLSTTIQGKVHGTENPLTKRPSLDPWIWLESARKQHLNELKTRMKINQLEYPQTLKELKSVCEQELEQVLEEISKMTSEDNRGPLENLYGLKFPNCDRQGLYNLKQCNMSNHGQRGECWCVDPYTGVQIPATPRVRGDPNCYQFQEDPTEADS
ncbi:hypothetical protein JOQ06_029871 [Pogonophryne albipinna]|uniref:Thyroglobulin type-1 domain-containing protein n=1 Tax=Pogonophryne albipinna TaxID=1090488 RepID=A0AAD6AX30_9TELE|nr:hypothetical protein JOQ06_029871 [Pogonophryne albipinna]